MRCKREQNRTFLKCMTQNMTRAKNNVDFIGYSSLNGRIKEKINKANDNRVRYWKNKIPQVLKDIER